MRALVSRRLERLAEASGHLLSVAAVLNREFDFALLQRAGALEESDTAGGVEELVRRSLLKSVGERFEITHDRIREVVYERLLTPRRMLLHRQVATALEALYASDLEPHRIAIGSHYRQGEVWDKAIAYLSAAGYAAVVRSAHRESIACWEQALDALAHLPRTPETLTRTSALRTALNLPLGQLALSERVIDNWRELDALARTTGDLLYVARAYPGLTFALASLGRLTEATEAGQRGLAIADSLTFEMAPTRAWGHVCLARAYSGLGDYARATALSRGAAALIDGHPRDAWLNGPRVSTLARSYLALDLATQGEFEEGTARGQEGVAMAETSGERRNRFTTALYLGSLYLTQGVLDRALSWLERTVPFWESGEIVINLPRAMSALGLARVYAGRLAEGLPLLEGAIAEGASLNLVYDRALYLAHLGEGYLLAGRLDDADRVAGQALELARAHGERGNEARIRRLLGDVASRRDPPRAAAGEAHYSHASTLAGALGMRPTVARSRLGLGSLLRRAGAAERARAELHQAVEDLRAMGMTLWIARAEAEFAQLA